MLHKFTWQQFSIVAIILSLIWYGIIFLLFYRKRIGDLLGKKFPPGTSPEPLTHEWDEDFEEVDSSADDNLMGKAALPEGMSRLSMAQFGFAPTLSKKDVEQATSEVSDDLENTNKNRERQQGLIPDVLEELKSIFHILETQEGTKEDFISLFALVRSKYSGVKGTANQQALSDYIRDNLQFTITDEELDNLWV